MSADSGQHDRNRHAASRSALESDAGKTSVYDEPTVSGEEIANLLVAEEESEWEAATKVVADPLAGHEEAARRGPSAPPSAPPPPPRPRRVRQATLVGIGKSGFQLPRPPPPKPPSAPPPPPPPGNRISPVPAAPEPGQLPPVPSPPGASNLPAVPPPPQSSLALGEAAPPGLPNLPPAPAPFGAPDSPLSATDVAQGAFPNVAPPALPHLPTAPGAQSGQTEEDRTMPVNPGPFPAAEAAGSGFRARVAPLFETARTQGGRALGWAREFSASAWQTARPWLARGRHKLGQLAAWQLAALGASLIVLVGLVAWIATGSDETSVVSADPPPAPAELDRQAPAPEPEPSAAAEPQKSDLERAAQGDKAAMDALLGKPVHARTPLEALAIAKGRQVSKRKELDAFGSKLLADPSRLEDADTLARLRSFVEDRDTTIAAMTVVAQLPGPVGPDLLYEVWVSTPKRTETTQLAEELVYSNGVREKASEALSVALDLRETEACETVLEILPRAAQHGDRRSAHLLGRLLKRRGCGPAKANDCYACLRPLDEDKTAVTVVSALYAVRRRKPPVIPPG